MRARVSQSSATSTPKWIISLSNWVGAHQKGQHKQVQIREKAWHHILT